MKRIVYTVFSLCSIGFTGSVLAAQYLNILVGLLGFAVTYLLGVYALETFDMKIKDASSNENTFTPKV